MSYTNSETRFSTPENIIEHHRYITEYCRIAITGEQRSKKLKISRATMMTRLIDFSFAQVY